MLRQDPPFERNARQKISSSFSHKALGGCGVGGPLLAFLLLQSRDDKNCHLQKRREEHSQFNFKSDSSELQHRCK